MRLILITLFPLLVIVSIFRDKYFVFGEWNQTCATIMCSCCIDRHCGDGPYFRCNTCLRGCIDGHRGSRCYEMCTYNCKSCSGSSNICETCFDGFYVGPKKDCKSCPANCKTCSSNSHCDTCKEGFYDKDGSSTCDYSICPTNCECDGTNCVACKSGFYDVNNSCNKTCPFNFEGNKCDTCKHGFHGSMCDQNCSQNCLYNSCDELTGICKNGCATGYSGDKCCVRNNNCMQCISNTECRICKPGYFNFFCNKRCPANCLDSCDISTGFCKDCILNQFGSNCSYTCSEKCKPANSSEIRKCFSYDGTCAFGCAKGYSGHSCQKKCSRFCIDGMCFRDSGICVEGCTGSYNDPVCGYGSGNPQPVSAVIAVLASLLVVTAGVLGFLMLKTFVKKIRSADRQPTQSMVQVHFENPLVEEQTDLNETHGQAHDLPQPKALQSADNAGNKVYENMKLN